MQCVQLNLEILPELTLILIPDLWCLTQRTVGVKKKRKQVKAPKPQKTALFNKRITSTYFSNLFASRAHLCKLTEKEKLVRTRVHTHNFRDLLNSYVIKAVKSILKGYTERTSLTPIASFQMVRLIKHRKLHTVSDAPLSSVVRLSIIVAALGALKQNDKHVDEKQGS